MYINIREAAIEYDVSRFDRLSWYSRASDGHKDTRILGAALYADVIRRRLRQPLWKTRRRSQLSPLFSHAAAGAYTPCIRLYLTHNRGPYVHIPNGCTHCMYYRGSRRPFQRRNTKSAHVHILRSTQPGAESPVQPQLRSFQLYTIADH